MLKKFCLLVFIFSNIFFSSFVFAERENPSYLAVSDIHFTPFDLCFEKVTKKQCTNLIAELRTNDSNTWKSIFQKYYEKIPYASFGQDTNFPLLQSFFEGIKSSTKSNNFSFVLILGDFLAHRYIQNYKLYSGDLSVAGQTQFIKKTFQYLTDEIRASIPNGIEIYPVLGNNDSYIANYNVDNPKTSSFYNDLSNIWAGFSQQIYNSPSFKEGGYYSAVTPIKGLTVIALNTTPFSVKAINNDKADINKIIKDQLGWINKQLNSSSMQKALIISHIPPGIDAYASQKSISRGELPIPFWNKDEDLVLKPYLKILSNNFLILSGIMVGHTHFDGFQVLNNDLELYTLSVPSISPVHFNNSGYKIVSLDENNNIKNFSTYYLDRSKNIWKFEYSFNEIYESKNVFLGLQSLIGKWLKNPTEADTKYAKNFTLNADTTSIVSNWKYYLCSASDNLTIDDYQDCLSSVR